MRVAIKFCGVCNPEIDVDRVGSAIGARLRKSAVEVVPIDSTALDALVMLCGCPKACVDRPDLRDLAPLVILVAGETVDYWMTKEEDIPATVERRLGLNGASEWSGAKESASSKSEEGDSVAEDEKGARQTLVLIHGSGGSAQRWNHQVAYFTRKGYRVVAVDLPGHGKSQGPGRRDIAAYADDVEALLRAQGIHRPVIGGHSMGGGVALTMAVRSPQAYSGLVLIGTGARLRVLPAIFEAIKSDFGSATEMMARNVYSSKAPADELRRAVQQLREVSPDVLYGDFEACDKFDIMRDVGSITTPTLIIVGREDVMTPVKYAEYLRTNIPNSDLEVIDDAGHVVMMEQPNKVNAALERWLERLS